MSQIENEIKCLETYKQKDSRIFHLILEWRHSRNIFKQESNANKILFQADQVWTLAVKTIGLAT